MEQRFKSKLAYFDSKIWNFHLRVPIEIAQFYKGKGIKRLIAEIDNREKIHCAILHDQEGPYLLINAYLRKKLNLSEGSSVEVLLKEDKSKYGMELSEEFSGCLEEDAVAKDHFAQLSPGKQRNLIHLVNRVKDPSIRIRRSLSILEHLNREAGKLDFKKLNALIKEHNERYKI